MAKTKISSVSKEKARKDRINTERKLKEAEDKSLRQRATEFIAPAEKAVSDFFGNPLENLAKNAPSARKQGKKKREKTLRDK